MDIFLEGLYNIHSISTISMRWSCAKLGKFYSVLGKYLQFHCYINYSFLYITDSYMYVIKFLTILVFFFWL